MKKILLICLFMLLAKNTISADISQNKYQSITNNTITIIKINYAEKNPYVTYDTNTSAISVQKAGWYSISTGTSNIFYFENKK